MNKLFFDPVSIGFFDDSVHGTKKILVPDSEWIRPTIQVPDQEWVESENEPEAPLITVPDTSIEHPLIEVPNPDCLIPKEAVEITQKQYQALLKALEDGKTLAVGEHGQPVAIDPTFTPDEQVLQIKAIAGNKINTLVPQWKQLNMTARAVELQHIAREAGELTVEQQAELDGIAVVWAKVRAIRDYSNSLEGRLATDSTIDIQAGWPE